MKNETFAEYVKRVMNQKGLTAQDVEDKCGKQITSSYISRVINGKVTNPTLDSIVALGIGLDINPYDVFTAAYGEPQTEGVQPQQLVDVMQRLVLNPELIEILNEWVKLTKKEQEALRNYIHLMAQRRKQKSSRKKS